MSRRCLTILLPALALIALPADAEVKLPGIFATHMVVQRETPVPVWGWADPGEKVTVSLAGQTRETTADAEGKWSARLDPIAEPGPHTLTVVGKNTIELPDVLAGEVWLGSGQSNMLVFLTPFVDLFHPSAGDARSVQSAAKQGHLGHAALEVGEVVATTTHEHVFASVGARD